MDSIQKFQELLKGLFQFETSDLDFGIYRILNYKRGQVERFIEKDLVDRVESAFAKYKDERLINISQRFEDAKAKITQALGKEAFTPAGELKEQFENTPLGRDYLSIKAQKDEAQTIDEIKLQVFNDLYSFFSRFYEEGDFVPQYRYSIKGHKYAIPYNGEGVKLYWANQDQYYTKTGLLFRDYTFKAGDYKIIFRIVSAREELGSKKATKERFFVLDDDNPVEHVIASALTCHCEERSDEAISNKTLIIRFQYRELTEEEVRSYGVEGGSNASRQEKINQAIYGEVLQRIKDLGLKAFLSTEHKPMLSKNEGAGKALLLYQLSRFTAKNTKDYFIHKNLKRFLSEQLDYFIKAEVLSIDTLEKEKFLDKHITRAKVVREMGEDIIDFLAQIEDFQKRLWEKKKFVLRTEYVITTDRIFSLCHSERSEESVAYFYNEIWNNKEQKKEWKDLGFEIPSSVSFLRKQESKLPVDTRYFSPEFKEELLEKLTEGHSERSEESLDDLLDGVLIKSENWQALNLLMSKYAQGVQTIYIDPPFNTGEDFLYRDRLRNSTWLALIKDRIDFVKPFLRRSGAFYLHLDENANYYGRMLLEDLQFASVQEIIFNTNATKDEEADLFGYKSFGDRFVLKHNTIFYCFNSGCFFRKLWKPNRNTTRLNIGWLDLISRPRADGAGKVQDFDFFIESYGDDGALKLVKVDVNEKVFPLGDLWTDIYSFTQSEMRTSENVSFLTQKPENLIRRILQTSSKPNDLIMDYFAGSGTTLAVAHKLKRAWIGVEMADCFNEFYIEGGTRKLGLMGRLKAVLHGDKKFRAADKIRRSHLSHDINWQGGGFFKYQILEQYEDTLDNIELVPNKQAELKFGNDYLLKYFLDYETRENPSLLNIEHLKRPFAYKLKVNLEEVGEPQEMAVDIPETFNYLLGLKVKKVKAREIATPRQIGARKDKKAASSVGRETAEAISKRKYLFILGEKEGKNIAIVWRDYDDNWSEDDFKADKEFIIEELQPWTPHIVYLNGQSILTPKLGEHPVEIRYIEPEFRRLMG